MTTTKPQDQPKTRSEESKKVALFFQDVLVPPPTDSGLSFEDFRTFQTVASGQLLRKLPKEVH